ncbi:MAG TPA: hypothetical protein O0X27_01125 [Methanocorpusculum sp.]|nr:hypothetical protein [Methanocorpusculum sp.]
MKQTGIIAICCMTLLVIGSLFAAGCVSSPEPSAGISDTDIIGTWTVSGTFIANGELCNAAFTFNADGTGLRELIVPATGNTISAENLTWERTGEFDNLKISYEDGLEEIMSLGWLKGTW